MELNKKLKIPGVRELIQITINREEWHLRTPLQKFGYLYGIGKAWVNIDGPKHEIVQSNYRLNHRVTNWN